MQTLSLNLKRIINWKRAAFALRKMVANYDNYDLWYRPRFVVDISVDQTLQKMLIIIITTVL